ncbi:MAG: acireductone synthase [Arenimonas sp.]
MSGKAIVTDIEGTTSSISFVKDVLFPYARQALPGFVAEHGGELEVRHWLDRVRDEIGEPDADDARVVATLQSWIDADRKHTALKALQGSLWQAGYADGDYQAHIYADAATALRRWHAAGHPLHVYSSGSVPAQQLLFKHTTAGDLSPLMSGWFDTRTGGKREVESYRRIHEAIHRGPGGAVFLSDVVEELDAARTAGFDTVLIDRIEDYPTPRTATQGTHGHQRVTSFDGLEF